jgi:hypothetical protein
MGLLGGLGIAALFYFAAEYEHMRGWKWALASLAVYVTVDRLFVLSFIFVLPAQFGLFLVMWWANSRRLAAFEVEKAARQEVDQRLRQERARLSREKVDPELAAREAAAAAKEEAAMRERQERVRLVREQREREERERAAQEQAARNKPPPGGGP